MNENVNGRSESKSELESADPLLGSAPNWEQVPGSEYSAENPTASSSELHDKNKGVVKWFNDAKGFGFIEHSDGQDVFVHFSAIESEGFKTLKDGDQVEYEMKQGPKGFHAVRVHRMNNRGSSRNPSKARRQDSAIASDDAAGAQLSNSSSNNQGQVHVPKSS